MSAPSNPSTKPRSSANKPARSRAREFALQGIYQYLLSANPIDDIDLFTRDLSGFHKAEIRHYQALLHGCVEQAAALDALIMPRLDRPMAEISPIEHAIMWMGTYELQQCPDVPWRVVLNEYVELAKSFGGTDGYKYVNGVLHSLAPQLRPAEVEVDRPAASG